MTYFAIADTPSVWKLIGDKLPVTFKVSSRALQINFTCLRVHLLR